MYSHKHKRKKEVKSEREMSEAMRVQGRKGYTTITINIPFKIILLLIYYKSYFILFCQLQKHVNIFEQKIIKQG